MTNWDADRWYFKGKQGNQVLSTREEILAAIESGALSSETLIWRPGARDWEPAYKLAEFQGLVPPPLPSTRPRTTTVPPASTRGPDFWEDVFDVRVPIGRAHFLGYWLLAIAAHWVIALPALVIESPGWAYFVVAAALMLAVVVVQVIVVIKRLRDLPASPWLATLLLVPVVGFGLILVLIFKRGMIDRSVRKVGSVRREPKHRDFLASYELPIAPNNPLWLLLPVGTFVLALTPFFLIASVPWAVFLYGLAALPEKTTDSSEAKAV